MTNDWSRHVESLKARLNELNETVETIRSSVEARPGLAEATHAISSLMNSADSLDQGLARFPGVVSEILENSVLGAVLIGPHGKFLLHNQTAGEILGYNFILNRSDASLRFEDEHGNFLDSDALPWSIALTGESVTDLRLHLKHAGEANGSWITFSATPFLNSDHSVGGAMLFMLDTTEEVVLEESIENLCQTISSQIAQVGSTQDQLQDLASKLSKTGVQRLLSDRSPHSEDEEEPSHLKKSIARHTEEEYPDSESLSTSEEESAIPDFEEPIEPESQPEHLEEEVEYIEEHEEEAERSSEAEAEAEAEAESLFGRMADLTESRTESKSSGEEGEEEENLPWPEVVDSEDYGQNLWEEYTQNDETTSSAWEEDEVVHPEPTDVHETVDQQTVQETEMIFEELDQIEQQFEDQEEEETPEESHEEQEPSIETEYSYVEEEEAPEAELETEPEAEEQEEEHTIEAEYEPLEESIEEPQAEAEPEPDPREEVKGGKSLLKTLFGKKNKKRRPRTSGTYAAIGGPNELDASYMGDEEGDGSESMVVNYNTTETVSEEPQHNKVLVVDDIPVNQKLLLLHLKRLGYDADVANNGKEALEAMEKTQYQVILMDCDMPVMNGFEAASKIRTAEAYSHRRVPIIALTSYDREGDRERCIAAGMDDYITKGSSRKELKEAIERSIVSAQEKSRGNIETPDDEDLHSDVEPLDINSMLKLYGQEEVEEISRLFLSNMAAYIECMQLAIDEKDADSVIHFANAVKGPCAALGMKLMTRLTTDIIELAEKEDWTQVRVKYMRLKAIFVQTQEELKKVCPDDSLISK
ncbi:MAG: response regulator [Candidatus Obscuribacterales bacterium]|nr:response regulator [Candidatus Obscuribacterales bacterium]